MTDSARLTLAIETSNPSAAGLPATAPAGRCPVRAGVSIGRVARDGSVALLAQERVEAGAGGDGLFPAIERAHQAAGLRAAAIEAVAVSIGPGGFTGVRIAVTAAKMIAEATGAACIAVPTARALIRRVPAVPDPARVIHIALAWKRGDVWIERYRSGEATPLEPGAVAPLEQLAIAPHDLLVADDALVALLRARSLIRGSQSIEPPCFDAAAVLEASASIAPTDPLALQPLYPREPEAVTKWRSLHPAR